MKLHDKVIRFQIHALRRMKKRGVSREQAERTIRKGAKGKAKRHNSVKFSLKISKKTTIVVIAEEGIGEIWVVTAWRK